MLKKIITEPLTHFLVLSIFIFIIYGKPEKEPADNYKVVVGEGRIEQLKNDIRKTKQRNHMAQELDTAIQSYVLNELYLREARELGLDQGDRIIERRLRQKMEYLLDEMASIQQPTTEQLTAFYESNIDSYLSPITLTFKQAFISTDRKKHQLEEHVKAQITRINNGEPPQSDMSMLPNEVSSRPLNLVEKDFGQQFSQQLVSLPLHQWYGPITSGFGKHFVYMETIHKNQPKPLNTIENLVIEDWQYQQRIKFKTAYEKELKRRYTIEIQSIQSSEESS